MRPTIALVVPNYNGARYLDECLASIEAQSHPVRVFIADGGSTDESVEIIERHVQGRSGWTWRSHRDDGQAASIREGFEQLDTDLVGWLNSDDVLKPSALELVADAAKRHPNGVLFHGNVDRINPDGRVVGATRSGDITYEHMRSGRSRTVQPGSFYRRWAVEAVGGISPEFYLLMDVDLWIRLARIGSCVRIDETLAEFRVHPDAKSSEQPLRYYKETMQLALRHERDALGRALVRRSVQIAKHFARHLTMPG